MRRIIRILNLNRFWAKQILFENATGWPRTRHVLIRDRTCFPDISRYFLEHTHYVLILGSIALNIC